MLSILPIILYALHAMYNIARLLLTITYVQYYILIEAVPIKEHDL